MRKVYRTRWLECTLSLTSPDSLAVLARGERSQALVPGSFGLEQRDLSMSQLENEKPRSIWRDPAFLLWWSVIALTFALSIKTLPANLREAREGNGLSSTEIASIERSLQWTHLNLVSFTYIQWGIAIVLQIFGFAIAWLIMRAPSRNRFMVLAAFVFVALTAATYPPDIPKLLPGQPVWQGIAIGITALAVFGFFVMPLLFPTGHLAGRWVIPIVLIALAMSASVNLIPQNLSDSPIGEVISIGSNLPLFGTIIASLALNYRSAAGEKERQQFKWVSLGMIVGLPLFLLGDFMMRHISSSSFGIASLFGFTLLMPFAFFVPTLAIGIAILRYQLFDIDLVLSQTLIWLSLSFCVIGTYIGVVFGIGELIGTGRNLVLSLFATGLVAIAFQPASIRIRTHIHRFVYGSRDEPYTVLSKLGHRIEAAATADDLLPAIIRTTVEALSLPYAAVFLESPAGPQLAASAGSLSTSVLSIPLTHGGTRIGTFSIGERSPGHSFSQIDQTLFNDLARQIAIAVQTVNLTNELQVSREGIIVAREEERRRLRRDLHDGLGSQLAALLIQTGSVRAAIHADPGAAEQKIDELRIELRQSIADIRRLVADLRPPALDEVGLVGALQDRFQRFAHGGLESGDAGLDIVFRVPETLPSMSAATEVALYRIAEEAITNVVKHAGATRVTITLVTTTGDVELQIADDGGGLKRTSSSGAGLGSMQDRAAELGGTLTITSEPEGTGTVVRAKIPVNRNGQS